MYFPPGKVILTLVVMVAVAAGYIGVQRAQFAATPPPDLHFLVFSRAHYERYRAVLPEFEAEEGVRVHMTLLNWNSLRNRLLAIRIAGLPMPDLVEFERSQFGALVRGPLDLVPFEPLNERLEATGLIDQFAPGRLELWTRAGRHFGVPKDVHPVMLAYRRDILAELGIDPAELTTWERFVAVAREKIVADLTGNGIIDRYAIDMSLTGNPELTQILIAQRGIDLFDARGRPLMHNADLADLIVWYHEQTTGANRISFPAGWGQNLAQALTSDLVVFIMVPDWRTRQIEMDMPGMAGKFGLMPLPAWEEGGGRTSTFGGTGMFISRQSENPEMAWRLAEFLALDETLLESSFRRTNIIPPFAGAWDLPVFDQVNAFWQEPLGRRFIEVAGDVPVIHPSPFYGLALDRIANVLARLRRHARHLDAEARFDFVMEELGVIQSDIEQLIERDRFLSEEERL